jgi:3-oxoacyl-[acyl-carrier-protein] synthase II
MKHRVAVTGMGIVSPIGNDADSVWNSIEQGVCGIAPITHFDTTNYKVKLAAEVKDLDMEAYFSKRDLKFNDRFCQFARIAAKQAFEDAKLDLSDEEKERFGVLIASGIGGIETIETCKEAMEKRGPAKVSPYFIPMALSNLAAGQVAIDLDAHGHCSCVVTACAAGTNAIGEAYLKIRDGYEDIMAAGGSEASITALSVAGFQSMRALHTGDDPKRASIPFDKERSGFVMGEGGAVLILEEMEHAKARNAKIYGEIVGYGASCDAHHITAPDPEGKGAVKAMVRALDDANIDPAKIDYVNAHGTSTPLNDKTETKALKKVFEKSLDTLAVSSTKSNTGHLLGASGAVEAVICLQALSHDMLPATINYKEPDEECDLDIVANTCRKKELHYVMSNSLGFGGHNASLIFRK